MFRAAMKFHCKSKLQRLKIKKTAIGDYFDHIQPSELEKLTKRTREKIKQRSDSGVEVQICCNFVQLHCDKSVYQPVQILFFSCLPIL
jgi:hypothetical protein